jgi:hypothetical protein
MGTAFSSSLLGLAGSLVIGLLELFVSHGTNRFYRELEDWLSSITRVGFSTGEAEQAQGGSELSAVANAFDTLTEQIETLQALYLQSDANRLSVDARLTELAGSIDRLVTHLGKDTGEMVLLTRIADGQERLASALALPENGAHVDAESRMRLRSIDVQLLRILEELSAGRQESISELRTDIATLTTAIRQLARGASQGRS